MCVRERRARGESDLASQPSTNLDDASKHMRIVVHLSESGDGHYLRDRTEFENLRVSQFGHVLDAVRNVPQSVSDKFVQASNSLREKKG